MIKRYISKMEEKSTHDRRQHALRVATVVTAFVFVGWLGTLGLRLGSGGTVATNNPNANQGQTASVIDGASMIDQTPNTLQVSTTSINY